MKVWKQKKKLFQVLKVLTKNLNVGTFNMKLEKPMSTNGKWNSASKDFTFAKTRLMFLDITARRTADTALLKEVVRHIKIKMIQR